MSGMNFLFTPGEHLLKAEEYLKAFDDYIEANPKAMIVNSPTLPAAIAHALVAIGQIQGDTLR